MSEARTTNCHLSFFICHWSFEQKILAGLRRTFALVVRMCVHPCLSVFIRGRLSDVPHVRIRFSPEAFHHFRNRPDQQTTVGSQSDHLKSLLEPESSVVRIRGHDSTG